MYAVKNLIFAFFDEQTCTLQRTFLGDTDRATSHANPECICACINEVFSLCSCHH